MQIFTMRAWPLFTATLACVLGMSLSAQAATVIATDDKSTYSVGESITITVIGDTQGGSAFLIFGRILYDGDLLSANGGNTQTKLRATGGAKWTAGTLLTTANSSNAFNQIHPNAPSSIPKDSTKKLTSIMTFTANAPGAAAFIWDTDEGPYGPQFVFFGATPSTPLTVTINNP